MELLTLSSGSLDSKPDPIAPLVNPEGERPTSTALSPMAAASAASGAASDATKNALGVEQGPGVKNILFIALVGFVVWKYGRRFLNA